MKTLREEIVELLMKRIGVVENEEFKGKGINGKYHNFKFAYGELFIKYNDKWHNTMLGGFIEDFEDYEFERINQERKDDNQTILLCTSPPSLSFFHISFFPVHSSLLLFRIG